MPMVNQRAVNIYYTKNHISAVNCATTLERIEQRVPNKLRGEGEGRPSINLTLFADKTNINSEQYRNKLIQIISCSSGWYAPRLHIIRGLSLDSLSVGKVLVHTLGWGGTKVAIET